MKKSSFDDVKSELEKACLNLRSFTLARHGFKERHGVDAIRRVNNQCARLSTLFASGPHAKAAAFIAQSARTRVLAAEARLAFLQNSRHA
jgi:hypothetical protein